MPRHATPQPQEQSAHAAATTPSVRRYPCRSERGLERVKGLLREYEANEARMAASDGRGTVSFQFLWDALGIAR